MVKERYRGGGTGRVEWGVGLVYRVLLIMTGGSTHTMV